MSSEPRLVLGPVLRHVGTHDATVWVEVDRACEVEVLGVKARTWCVAGHYFALIAVDSLAPGTSTPYDVRLDGATVWPAPGDARPAPRIRTLGGPEALSIVFGSCRYARATTVESDPHFAPDSLMVLGKELATAPEADWPHAVLMLGDQVYADETSPAVQDRIRQRRDIDQGAKDQVADFEEYTWLYAESWSDPDVRWLMSVVPSSMIFDDHDVRDDWNTSRAWRQEIQRTDWWQERIIGGLSSYWIYQHLGNLSPGELASDQLFQAVTTAAGDAEPLLREFATAADREADGGKGARWSYRRDFGSVRLLMVDSRCGRMLDEDRSMVSHSEMAWIEEQVDGDYDHLLIGTSLPWLLPRALHDLEAWNEALAEGARGRRWQRWSEKLRQAADLEHWAAFERSFAWLAGMIGDVAGRDGAPATVCVLSGDVHHAYVARAHLPGAAESAIFQLTCSPLHNYVPAAMKRAFRVAWSRTAERTTRRILDVVHPVPQTTFTWTREAGPFFGNELMTLRMDGRAATVTLASTRGDDDEPVLHEVGTLVLAGETTGNARWSPPRSYTVHLVTVFLSGGQESINK